MIPVDRQDEDPSDPAGGGRSGGDCAAGGQGVAVGRGQDHPRGGQDHQGRLPAAEFLHALRQVLPLEFHNMIILDYP